MRLIGTGYKTLSKVMDGNSNIILELTNDNHIIPYNTETNIANFSECYTKVNLYIGNSLETSSLVSYRFVPSGNAGEIVYTWDVDTRILRITQSSLEQGYIDVYATYKQNEYTSRFSFKKVSNGVDSYLVDLTNNGHFFSANSKGVIARNSSVNTEVIVYKGTEEVSDFSIRLPQAPQGMTISNSGNVITITALAGDKLPINGELDIVVTIGSKRYTKVFSWIKILDGADGAPGPQGPVGPVGPQGPEGPILDWVQDWDGTKVSIGTTKVLAPRIFAGIVSNGKPTGVAMGKDVFGTLNGYQGVTGIAGYKNGVKTYHLDVNGNFLVGQESGNYFKFDGSKLTVKADSVSIGSSSVQEIMDNKINNLTIGGTNLIRNSNTLRVGSTANNITTSITSDGYLQVVAQSGNGNWFTGFITNYEGIEDSFKEGDKFTISFTVKSPNSTAKPEIYIKSGMGYYPMVGNMSTEWSTIYYTGTWRKANSISMHLGFGGAIGTFIFKNIKLEKGNKPTDWTPAPEDAQNEMGLNIGLDKWRREVYDVSLANSSTYPTFENIVGLKPIYTDEFVDSTTMLTGISASDTYIVLFKTNAYVSTSKTIVLTPSTTVDDTLTAYVNGIEVSRVNGTENTNLSLKQGWNSIVLLFYEHTGGEVLNFRTKLSDLVDKIAYGINSNTLEASINTVSSKVADIKIGLDNISSKVSSVETTTNRLEKLTEKKLINNFSNSNTLDLWSAPGTTLKYSSIVGYYMDCLSNNLNHMIQSEYFEIDSSKSYKISLMQQFAPNSGTATFYFGVYAYDKDKNNIGVYIDNSTSLQTNPYFMSKRNSSSDYGKWNTWSGYIYSHDTAIQTYTPKGNVTSCMKFSPKTKYLKIRFLHYRNGTYGDSKQGNMYFAQPAIYEIDNQIVNTEQRLKTAEQKITNEAIINTVSNATSKDGELLFAKKSEIKQLDDSWTATFTAGYDQGIVTMNQGGITVTSSNVNSTTSMTANGFKITKTTGGDVFKVDSNGNLEIYGTIRSNSEGNTRAELHGTGLDFYYGSTLIGTVSHDSTGGANEARDRLWLRTKNNYALKLQAVNANCSVEANNLYLKGSTIHLTPGERVYVDGNLEVAGSLIANNVVAVFG